MKLLDEFKAFALRGNVLDMAVGVIIGGAFGKIVSSLVDDIFMPLIGIAVGGVDFSALSVKIGEADIIFFYIHFIICITFIIVFIGNFLFFYGYFTEF